MYFGTVEAAFEIAELNKISITADLFPGQILKLPKKGYGFSEVANYFEENKINPATAANEGTGIGNMIIGVDFGIAPDQEGISIWAIELDFIVQPNN